MLMDQVQGKEKQRRLLSKGLLFCQLHFTSRYFAIPSGGRPGMRKSRIVQREGVTMMMMPMPASAGPPG